MERKHKKQVKRHLVLHSLYTLIIGALNYHHFLQCMPENILGVSLENTIGMVLWKLRGMLLAATDMLATSSVSLSTGISYDMFSIVPYWKKSIVDKSCNHGGPYRYWSNVNEAVNPHCTATSTTLCDRLCPYFLL